MTTFDHSATQACNSVNQFRMNTYISFFNHCSEGMFCINQDGFFTEVNPALINLCGYSEEELINTLFLDLVLPEDLGETITLFEKVKQGYTETFEVCLLHKNGRRIHTNVTAIPTIFQGKLLGIHGLVTDITEKISVHESLQEMSSCDQLTRLPNRNQLSIHLKQNLARLESEELNIAVLYLNLDRFKLVNDTLGHGTGDQILKLIAYRLRNSITASDFVSRLGGDEFLITLTRKTSSEIEAVANAILQNISEPIFFSGHDLIITASIGICLANQGNIMDEFSLIRFANIAMSYAKRSGGNCYKLYSKTMGKVAMRKLLMERTFTRALAGSEFAIYYQPQYDIETNQIIGAEALVRWNHPHLGLISPLEFIPLAEESNFIVPLGNWILENACTQFRQWLEQGHQLTRLSVNISVVQLYQDDFYQNIISILEKTGLDPSYLELEITESKTLNYDSVKYKISSLREKGVRIAIDDFGTGYSPLSHLQQISINTLKIDRGFIRNICQNYKDQVIVQSIVKMARMMNLNIIVEGVENLDQLLLLQAHNLKEAQGYYFSPPLKTKEFEKLLIA